VLRNEGDPVWSGTFAVKGAGLFEAKAVGAESRAEKLTATARTFRHPRSPLERANDRLLVGLVVVSLPLAVGLTVSVLTRVRSGTAQVQAIVAGLANLIPEGLILLLSITAATSAYRFARRGVLAQQLNAIESLASVDTLCTDKTGTLTEPNLRVVTLVPAAGVGDESLRRELARYAASSPSRNATLNAIADARLADVDASAVVKQVSFSSRRRWSALDLGDERLVLGAPEWFADADGALSTRARQEANEGRRVLAIGRFRARLQRITPSHNSRQTSSRSGLRCSPSGSARMLPRRSRSSPRSESISKSSPATRRPPSARSHTTPGSQALPRRSMARPSRETLKSSAAPFSRRPRSDGSHPRASAP
jgi:cation-transporting P-type ATPase E